MIFIFDNAHFISSGIQNNVPPLLQFIMWELIKQMPVDKDYLQVFSLSANGDSQRIKHTQEVPEYCKEYVITIENPITEKVFVIDDTTHSTMILAEEY